MKTTLATTAALLGLLASAAVAAEPAPTATGPVRLTDAQLDEILAGDVGAAGAAVNVPGIVSGNVVQVPVHVPVNVCGNTINVVGLLNPTFGNVCVND